MGATVSEEPVRWWEPGDPGYDRKRAVRMQREMLRLIERDVNFALDAMVMGLHYPDHVDLYVECVEQDEDPDEDKGPSDDWYFKLECPAFRVVLNAVGRGGLPLEERDFSILKPDTVFVDEVVNEDSALQWLASPLEPETRGYR